MSEMTEYEKSLVGGGLVCSVCGHHGETNNETPGSLLIEIVLWCSFLVPGIIYSIWRHSAKKDVCGKCSSPALIPADSPRGRKLIKESK